jgi:hypothetical protein
MPASSPDSVNLPISLCKEKNLPAESLKAINPATVGGTAELPGVSFPWKVLMVARPARYDWSSGSMQFSSMARDALGTWTGCII